MGRSKDLATRVGIDDNADATAITITSQENVGIGTASPSNYGAAYTSLGVSGSSASAIEGFVGSNLVGYLQAYNTAVLVGSKTNVPLKLVTNDTIQMTIDGSGRVTMPYQPWFHVVLNSNVTSVTTGNQLLNAWGAGIKGGVGSHFSSNKFTAPVAGKYLFCYSGLHNSGSGGYSRAYHAVNGAVVIDGLGDDGTSGNYQRIAYSIILSLAANDYVEIKVNSAQSDAYVYSYYTTWSGQLIG